MVWICERNRNRRPTSAWVDVYANANVDAYANAHTAGLCAATAREQCATARE